MSRIAHWLAIVEPRQSWLALAPQYRDDLARCGIVGISVRAGRPGWVDCAADAHNRGLRVHIEAWCSEQDGIPGVTAADGALTGQRFARWMDEARADGIPVEAARVNAEAEVWRGVAGKENPDAVAYLDALADEYHAAEVGALQYLGFASPGWHYPGAVIPAHHRSRYQDLPSAPRLWAMAYQSDEDAIRKTLARAQRSWPGVALGAYAGVGRIDGRGRVVGSELAWRAICAEPPDGLEAVTWYVGLDQAGGGLSNPRNPSSMLMQGHSRHAPLVRLIADLTAPGRGPAEG